MTPDMLYEIFRQMCESEDVPMPVWDRLQAPEMIAWGKLCRLLQREYRLEVD